MTLTWAKFRWWRFLYTTLVLFLAIRLCGWYGILIVVLAQVDLEVGWS